MKKFLIIAVAITLIGFGCSKKSDAPTDSTATGTAGQVAQPEPEPEKDPNQPLQYELEEVPAVIERSLSLVRKMFTPEQLVAQSAECGTNQSLEHYTELLSSFRHQRVQHYTFLYRNQSQEPTKYQMYVMYNDPEYQDLEAFKRDFDFCAAGGLMLPLDLNEDWLVFESGCGVESDDESELPMGCKEIRDQILSTLTIF